MSRHNIVIIQHWERMLNRHRDSWKYTRRGGRSRGRKSHLTRSLVASEGWSSVRDRTNRKHCPSTKYGHIRGMVVGEGGRSTGVLLYMCFHRSFALQINLLHSRDLLISFSACKCLTSLLHQSEPQVGNSTTEQVTFLVTLHLYMVCVS